MLFSSSRQNSDLNQTVSSKKMPKTDQARFASKFTITTFNTLFSSSRQNSDLNQTVSSKENAKN